MASERFNGFACRQIPNPQRFVPRARNEVATIPRDRYGTDSLGMALNNPLGFLYAHVSEPQRAVYRSGNHTTTIVCDSHGSDIGKTTLSPPISLSCGQISNPEHSIRGAEDHRMTIGRYRLGNNPSGVTAKAVAPFVWPLNILLISPVTKSQTLQHTVIRARGKHVATTNCHCHGTDPIGMVLERHLGFPASTLRRLANSRTCCACSGESWL